MRPATPQQRGAARPVEFAEDVVQQEHRRRIEMPRQQIRGAQLERQHERPLLAFTGEARGVLVEINPMSSRCGPTLVCRSLASSVFRRGERCSEVITASFDILDAQDSRAPLMAACMAFAAGSSSAIKRERASVTRVPAARSGSSKAAISRQRGEEDFSRRLRERSARS